MAQSVYVSEKYTAVLLTAKEKLKSKLIDQFDVTVCLLINWINYDSFPGCTVSQQVSVRECPIIQQLFIKAQKHQSEKQNTKLGNTPP